MKAIVLTTVNIPFVLEEYIQNLKAYGHKDVVFIVVGDMKSPIRTQHYINTLRDYPVIYMDVEFQDDWLHKHGEFRDFMPYNSVARRNIGYLYAGSIGAEMIISIDDDNIPLPEYDYLGEHSIVGNAPLLDMVSSPIGWFNPCHLLNSNSYFYHRGFPLSKRVKTDISLMDYEKRRVVVNAGLWLGDPDVDTQTRVDKDVVSLGLLTEKVALSRGTMAPFNSQNTAFHIDLLPCMYLITFRSGMAPAGDNSFRYDDIWMSYFAQIIIHHMNDAICYGTPLVRQERNKHDYTLDLEREREPMVITDILADILPEIRLTERTYMGAYQELTEYIDSHVITDRRFRPDQQDFLEHMVEGMRLWTDVLLKGI